VIQERGKLESQLGAPQVEGQRAFRFAQEMQPRLPDLQSTWCLGHGGHLSLDPQDRLGRPSCYPSSQPRVLEHDLYGSPAIAE